MIKLHGNLSRDARSTCTMTNNRTEIWRYNHQTNTFYCCFVDEPPWEGRDQNYLDGDRLLSFSYIKFEQLRYPKTLLVAKSPWLR